MSEAILLRQGYTALREHHTRQLEGWLRVGAACEDQEWRGSLLVRR
jgi:hypothetical protein